MDIKRKIILLEKDLQDLRESWKKASIPMKKVIEKKARGKKTQISIFGNILKRRMS